MSKKLLSVITINLNNSYGLTKTIESVINQKFKEFEFIIIDGASNDDSIEVIENYKEYFAYSISETDFGIFDAMNKGIEKATGKYLIFLNSGDYLANEDVFYKVSSFLSYDYQIVYGNIYLYRNDENRIQLVCPPIEIDEVYMYKQSIWHQASFIRLDLFKKYGYYSIENRFSSDWEFFLQLVLIENIKPTYVNLTISVFDTGGITWNPLHQKALDEERAQILRKYFSEQYLKLLEITYQQNIELAQIKKSRIFKWSKSLKLLLKDRFCI